MRHYIKALIISTVAFIAAQQLVPTIMLGPTPKNLAIVIGGLLIVSLLIRPIFSLILLPINMLTLGSIPLILNVAFLFALTIYLPNFSIGAYDFRGANINGVVLPPYSFNQITTLILVAFIITAVQKVFHIIFE